MSQAQPDESRPDAAEEVGQDPAGAAAKKSAFAGDRPAHLSDGAWLWRPSASA